MEFKEFKRLFQKHFEKISKDADVLFEVGIDKDVLWNLYLDSFPPGTNEIYRTRREHDCSCCRHFIKNFGGVVVIKNNQMISVWDFEVNDPAYQAVVDALSRHVKSCAVTDVHWSKERIVGTDRNFEEGDGTPFEWQHFQVTLPDKFVDRTGRSEGDFKGVFRDTRNVFKRSLDEISRDSVETVLELISQNSLYKGEEWKAVLTNFLKLKKDYDKLTTEQDKENYCWEQAIKVGAVIGRIRNHSIGTLLVAISAGEELDSAVRSYEKIVAPTNYKRPQAIFTKQMLESAKKTIGELGYSESLKRRYANLDDITVNNILFSNKDAAERIKGTNVLDDMMAETSGIINPKKFSKIEEISVEDFVNGVLPTAKSLEVFLENKHSESMVSLIAPENKDAPTMFKWSNGFSWAYTGNITDSAIREHVKAAGGNVEGVLRFSIQWNDRGPHDQNDLDAHCMEPNGHEIWYANKRDIYTGGTLDVDIMHPHEGVPAVENITWARKEIMPEGKYQFFVHGYANRGGREGFKAEVEFDGQIFSFDYNTEVRQGQRVEVAEVVYNRSMGFSIKEKLPSSVSSRDIWNLKTNQFVPVSVVCYSPNYWDEQDGIGNRHYFFMLKDCVNPELPNGFYNEFLKEDLMKHKRVFEALGARMAVKDNGDQLSGIGFSSTKRNDLIVKVSGQSERIIKVKF